MATDPIDYEIAQDSMYGVLQDILNAEAPAVLGYAPKVYWDMVEEPEAPPVNLYHIRAGMIMDDEQQTSFNTSSGSGATYTSSGFMNMWVMCPRSDANVLQNGRKLAILIRNAYRNKRSGGVWYRNPKIVHKFSDEQFFRLRVMAEFEYYEID